MVNQLCCAVNDDTYKHISEEATKQNISKSKAVANILEGYYKCGLVSEEQLKEHENHVKSLQDQLKDKEREIGALNAQHEQKINELNVTTHNQSKECEREINTLKGQHEREINSLNARYEQKIDSLNDKIAEREKSTNAVMEIKEQYIKRLENDNNDLKQDKEDLKKQITILLPSPSQKKSIWDRFKRKRE